jgi:hypothetical protein
VNFGNTWNLNSNSVPTSWKCGLRLLQVESDFDWSALSESPMSRRHRPASSSQVIAAIVLGIGGPCAAYELRGLCWEALLWSLVIFAIALMLVRLPRCSWLARAAQWV